MITGKTSSGFAYAVAENAFDDFRVVEAIADMQGMDKGDSITGTVSLMRLVLGRDGMEALKAHVAEADGRVPPNKIDAEITEIFKAVKEHDAVKK